MEVKVEFFYPKLEFVSDRTFRESLKLASQKLHQIHLDEVLYIVETSDISDRLRQSAVDRMVGQLDHIPNYYIESVTRGSLTVLVTLSAAALFILQKTLGKTIEAAWERTPTHKRMVEFFSNTAPAASLGSTSSQSPSLVERSLGTDGERWQWLERAFSFQFLNNPRFGRFKVVKIAFEQDKARDMLVRVEFALAEDCLELEGTFKQFLYKDYLNQFVPSPTKQAKKKKKSSMPAKKASRKGRK
jgi:hypothetical protein